MFHFFFGRDGGDGMFIHILLFKQKGANIKHFSQKIISLRHIRYKSVYVIYL